MRDLYGLPKAHLHVHLESTVRWPTLREIGAAGGVPVPERGGALFGGSMGSSHRTTWCERVCGGRRTSAGSRPSSARTRPRRAPATPRCRSPRPQHGIRVLDDPDLVAEVRRRRIPLEVCPSSNVALGFASSLAAHPLPRLREAGLIVTVSTDIPALIDTPLAVEYTRIRDTFGYDDTVLAELARAGVDASFAPVTTTARLHQEIDTWLAAGPR